MADNNNTSSHQGGVQEQSKEPKRGRPRSLERESRTVKAQKVTNVKSHVLPQTQPLGLAATGSQEAPSKCTNKQIMEAINNLTDRINNIESNVSNKIDNLEHRLETKLIGKINEMVEAKVNEQKEQISADVNVKVKCAVQTETMSLRTEVDELRDENKYVTDTLLQHQRYLESIEAAKRAANIVITGLPESDMEINGHILHTDVEKTQHVLAEIDQQTVEVEECIRLGQVNPEHPRVMKVKLKNPQDRKLILNSAKKLKQKGPPLNKVYLKKDVHPMVRKEFARLRKIEQKEKAKAENEGRSVTYDAESRTVLVDGIIIDKFRASFL
jgi:hypothetical protein